MKNLSVGFICMAVAFLIQTGIIIMQSRKIDSLEGKRQLCLAMFGRTLEDGRERSDLGEPFKCPEGKKCN